MQREIDKSVKVSARRDKNKYASMPFLDIQMPFLHERQDFIMNFLNFINCDSGLDQEYASLYIWFPGAFDHNVLIDYAISALSVVL